jgi:N-acetyl-gamma-glutamyl-phosphate reductase
MKRENMLRAAIIGASGYTGGELARLLGNHPEVTITAATSRQYSGIALSEVYPHLRQQVDIVCRDLSVEEVSETADFVFCAVPHKTAMDIVPALLQAGKKVVDLSADFRLKDVSVYEQWYQKHSAPELVSQAAYGLPEINHAEIRQASLVANPGCYVTSITLALAPLLSAGLINIDSIIADSKSGTSGAGRSPGIGTLFCEVTDGFKPYKVGGNHRHIPEIEQNLSLLAGQPVTISFTPHLLPVSRGILSTIYADLKNPVQEAEVRELFRSTYEKSFFVRILGQDLQPATQYVRGSNFCDIGLKIDPRTNRIIVTSAIDNLVKGASGQAIQNMNLMCGFTEETGLGQLPLFP